jgi:antitoxin component of MazEF toxin-antitoxin module
MKVFLQKINKIGNSLYGLIPNEIAKLNNIVFDENKETFIEVELKKVIVKNKEA